MLPGERRLLIVGLHDFEFENQARRRSAYGIAVPFWWVRQDPTSTPPHTHTYTITATVTSTHKYWHHMPYIVNVLILTSLRERHRCAYIILCSPGPNRLENVSTHIMYASIAPCFALCRAGTSYIEPWQSLAKCMLTKPRHSLFPVRVGTFFGKKNEPSCHNCKEFFDDHIVYKQNKTLHPS